MEISVYEDRAKQIVANIKEVLDTNGMDLDAVIENAGLAKDAAERIFSGESLPSLPEFLMLCEISGITLKLPFVETPDNPM